MAVVIGLTLLISTLSFISKEIEGMTQLEKAIEYDFLTWEKTIHKQDGTVYTVDMDLKDFIEFVKSGELGINDLPDAYNSFDTLNTIYNEINPKEQIASEIVEGLNLEIFELEIDELYLEKNYSDEISEKVKDFISELYTTDDIFSVLENEDVYKQFVADEVEKTIFEILRLTKSSEYI